MMLSISLTGSDFPLTRLSIGVAMKKTLWFLVAALPLSLVGCSDVPDFGGGASVVPDVTFVPADAAADASSEAAVESTGTAATGEPGTFTGKVVMTGSVTPLPPMFNKGADIKDSAVCAAVDVPDERLVLGDGNVVRGVFIYLNKAPKGGKPLAAPAEPFKFDQKNCRFFPHCVIIPVGQEVKVLSDDTIAHNTHTNPKKNPSVNAGVSPGDREGKLSFTYRKTESVPLSITCDYHTWMKAYQLPVDHPYAAVTDENGAFTIPDLPPGKHSFVVWHEAADGGFVERKLAVEIKSGETTEMQIDYPSDRLNLKR
ncbi:MAG: hypothetical protein H7Z17_19275 [Fuerstia sp.]|nr:hypothetical protein [Fuerstiella sp.]